MIEVKKWIGISGSWRETSPQIGRDVRTAVQKIISEGDGIITGGALNVDYIATDQVLQMQKPQQLKIFLSTTLDRYAAHYRKRVDEGVITHDQAETLISQLEAVKEKNPHGLIENPHNTIVDTTTYFERNQAVVDASDELIAFQVNNSGGTQDTIEKAKKKGIPITVFSYTV